MQQNEADFESVLYLKQKPDRETVTAIIAKLEDPVDQLVRRDKFWRDKIAGERGMDESELDDPEVVMDLLVEVPKLLQRPIVVTPDKAVIGRPRDRIPALFA